MASRKPYPFDDPFAGLNKFGGRTLAQCRAVLATIAGVLIFVVMVLILVEVLAPATIQVAHAASQAQPALRGDSLVGLGLLCLSAFLGLAAWRIGRAAKQERAPAAPRPGARRSERARRNG